MARAFWSTRKLLPCILVASAVLAAGEAGADHAPLHFPPADNYECIPEFSVPGVRASTVLVTQSGEIAINMEPAGSSGIGVHDESAWARHVHGAVLIGPAGKVIFGYVQENGGIPAVRPRIRTWNGSNQETDVETSSVRSDGGGRTSSIHYNIATGTYTLIVWGSGGGAVRVTLTDEHGWNPEMTCAPRGITGSPFVIDDSDFSGNSGDFYTPVFGSGTAVSTSHVVPAGHDVVGLVSLAGQLPGSSGTGYRIVYPDGTFTDYPSWRRVWIEHGPGTYRFTQSYHEPTPSNLVAGVAYRYT